ncbi:MAG: mucin-2 protein [Nocardioides sp.]
MADHRHKRDTDARRKPKAAIVAGPLAVLATATAVTIGVVGANPSTPALLAEESSAETSVNSPALGAADISAVLRGESVSRSAPRVATAQQEKREKRAERAERKAELAATARAVRQADQKLWTTTLLNLWSDSDKSAKRVGEIDSGKRVLVTGRKAADRVEIVIDGESRWVTAGYLSAEKPAAETAGIGGSCDNGTSVASGVSPNIVKVHQAVCAAFPEITTYGTFRGDGEHAQGIAVDIMVSGDRGWQVADFVREHYSELGVSYVIYSQNIWSVERGGEGWRGMSDRGSATANHYDHVHVTTY